MYLLDTNVCIQALNGRSESVIEHLSAHPPTSIKLCSIVHAELLHGARASERVDANLRLVKRFAAPFDSLPFDDLCAEHYGIIRADLARAGLLIGPNDLLIAAIARANDLTLVTHNLEEFSRVAGLRMEDWEV